ncbi:uncharacterized protein [Clytia hemisphaerica]|uniref:uncharacterized protein n=1 Tax=Clytia hemisphaerica TaxID=252671 RepID=UPI0034D3AAE8
MNYFKTKASTTEKRRKLESICAEVVDNYILRSSSAENYLTKKQAEFISVDGKFRCNLCDKQFEFIGKSLRKHLQTEHKVENKQDDMFHYQIALMEYLALWKNFADAVKEGDGERIIRCWKFIFIYLFNDGILN